MTADPRATALPAAYAPFAPILARLSEPLRRLLEGQLAQFEPIVPALRTQDMAHTGTFEGLGGLTHRGEPSHLLQSELLLHDAAPLEFLRRIAEGEALYFDKQYADPGARWLYRAMVSVGPGVLGHGRIIALATIFFLARVAAERDAAFHWCFLPRDDGAVWFEGVSVNAIKRFLRAASFREMGRDDRAAARGVWDALTADAIDHQRQCDWTIGADPARTADTIAPDVANALRFTVLPCGAGVPRTAVLGVRRGAREGARVTLQFPDDRLCVEALRNPFERAPAALAPAARLGDAIPSAAGWEPEHLALATQHMRLVRLDRGLLVLGRAKQAGFEERYFVPLPAGMDLVGVRITDAVLSLLVHCVRDGRETLAFAQYGIQPDKAPQPILTRARSVPSRHLFHKRSRFAIPPLNRHDGAEFYSASGQAYQLAFSTANETVSFTPLHQAPCTLHAVGQYRVTLADQAGTPTLRVIKNRRTELDTYRLPPGTDPDRLHAMVYAIGERSLTYCVTPGEWIIPATADRTGARMLRSAPHEMPLIAKINDRGEATARLWSDARYGGDGMVRWVREDGGRLVQTSQPLDLGPDSTALARLLQADDGLWGVTLAATGIPHELLRYRRSKREQRYVTQRYDLADLAANATPIELETADAAA